MTAIRPGHGSRSAALLPAAVCLTLWLGACGGSSSPTASSGPRPGALLNTQRVALAIERSILSEKHLHSTVVCPPRIPEQQGRSFVCVATTYARNKRHRLVPVRTLFTVFQRDNNGDVYYQSPQ